MSPFHIWILKIFMFQHFRSSGRTCTTPHSSQIASGAIFKPTAHKFIIMAMPSGLQETRNTRRRTICAGLCAKCSWLIWKKDVSRPHQSGSGQRASKNSCFVATLLPQYAPETRNLEDIRCPAIQRLLTGHEDRVTPETFSKALSLVTWVVDHYTHEHS